MRAKQVRISDICYRERVAILMQYQQQFPTTTAAARAMGISSVQACWLNKLARAPREVRDAIDRYDRTGQGLAFSAWREMADMPPEVQVQQLRSGRVTGPEIRADKPAWLWMLQSRLQ
jgi:hypothetical protein